MIIYLLGFIPHIFFSSCFLVEAAGMFSQPSVMLIELYAKAETPVLWPPDEKNQLTGKAPDAGKD